MEVNLNHIIEDFGFEDELELTQWSQTLCFDIRIHYPHPDGDDEPKNFRGWPTALATDGDCGVCFMWRSDEHDEAVSIQFIGCDWASIHHDYLILFRDLIEDADLEFNRCYEAEQGLKLVKK